MTECHVCGHPMVEHGANGCEHLESKEIEFPGDKTLYEAFKQCYCEETPFSILRKKEGNK